MRNPTKENEANFKKHRNYCVRLFKKEKKRFYNNINIKLFTDNKRFWKIIKPHFSEKHTPAKKITLVDKDKTISDDSDIAEVMNDFFTNIVAVRLITARHRKAPQDTARHRKTPTRHRKTVQDTYKTLQGTSRKTHGRLL